MKRKFKLLGVFISTLILVFVSTAVFAKNDKNPNLNESDTSSNSWGRGNNPLSVSRASNSDVPDSDSELEDSDETEDSSPTFKPKRPELIKDRIQFAKEKNQEILENLKERASEAAQKREEKLTETRLKICRARQNIITQRVRFLHEKAKLINKAHERAYNMANNFYTGQLVPRGYSLSNYSDLKAEVEANKANVLTLLDAAKANAGEFDCDSEDPKGQVDAFKEDMKALIEANQEYKSSIHDFVKAVRDLAKQARLEKLSPSEAPSVTQEASE